jgi:tetratricopeptide (TPR) repeat protein
MKTRMILGAAAALALGLSFGAPASRAEDNNADWQACEKTEDSAGQIAACSKIVSNATLTADDRAEAYYLRANAYGDKGEFDKAIADYTKAIELGEYDVFYASRCWAYGQVKDTAHALQDCDKAIALNPNLALAYVNRGVIYEDKGDIAKAIESYRAALAVKTDIEDELMGQDDAKAALERLGHKAG